MEALYPALVNSVDERKNRKRKQKNDAFRRRLKREKLAQRETLKLRIACTSVAAIWLFVGLQCLFSR